MRVGQPARSRSDAIKTIEMSWNKNGILGMWRSVDIHGWKERLLLTIAMESFNSAMITGIHLKINITLD